MSTHTLQRALLGDFMAAAPYQPATNYWRSIEIREVLKHGLPGGFGLDLGCGDGHLTAIIMRRLGQRRMIGVDVDPLETRMADQRGTYERVVCSNGNGLPFPDQTFDFVFSNSVLEHIPDIDRTLHEVTRVLRSGGKFLFTVPGPQFHECLARQSPEYWSEVDDRCAHLRYWSLHEWRSHLSAIGLTIEASSEFLSAAELQRWERIANGTSGLIRKFSRSKPIAVQRAAGIRSTRFRLPKLVAAAVAGVLSTGVRAEKSNSHACLLIEATKFAQ